ncbi:MAG: hypothetical protein ACOY3Y_11145 [Acidobacteriota bacterium]
MFELFLVLALAQEHAGPTPTPAAIDRLKGAHAGAEAKPGQPLSEVAKGIRLRFPDGDTRRLTNESVKSLGEGVGLTTAQPGPAPRTGSTRRGASPERAKELWQQRYQDARSRALYWDSEVKRLQAEVARLEADFYSRDDPAYRDGIVKPAWDKARADLVTATEQLTLSQKEPDQVAAQGSREGALPGWFRGLPEPTVPTTPPRPRPATTLKATPRPSLLPEY